MNALFMNQNSFLTSKNKANLKSHSKRKDPLENDTSNSGSGKPLACIVSGKFQVTIGNKREKGKRTLVRFELRIFRSEL